VLELLVEFLREDGHATDTASNGAEALERIGATAYDVIFSDVRMPQLSGPDFYREIARRAPELCRRFVLVTGDELNAETRAFLDETRVPNLGKPFDLPEIRQIVQRVLAAAMR